MGSGHSHHVQKVLRLKSGDPVSYTDGAGVIGGGVLEAGMVLRGSEVVVPRPTALTVVVAPPSARDRVRFLVEKAAELGVARLLWVRTMRTTGRPPRQDKATAWATAALEQSQGGWLIEMGTTTMADLDPHDLVVADPDGSRLTPPDRSTLLIGPEGGFDPDEIPEGAAKLSLGPTVLRVETATVAGVVSLISKPAPFPAR